MKKFRFLPIIMFFIANLISFNLFSRGIISLPMTIMIPIAVFLFLQMLLPKKQAAQPVEDLEEKILGDYARDAFADDAKLQAEFQTVLKNMSGNMPKAALKKLEKLSSQCRSDQQTYAVAMATALCKTAENDYAAAIREYNRAIIVNPNTELARTLGTCYQRQGELTKAIDSYEFALELDANNLEARCNLATACVASRDYEAALDHASMALDIDEKNASALATSAICYGLTGESLLYKRYTELAVENGYSEKKITETVSALKK